MLDNGAQLWVLEPGLAARLVLTGHAVETIAPGGGLPAASDWQGRIRPEPFRLDHNDAATLQSLRCGVEVREEERELLFRASLRPAPNRITDGRVDVRRASSVPKSVSADTTMRPSVAARSKISSSVARCMS